MGTERIVSRWLARTVLASALLAVMAVSGCRHPATEIVVRVRTDMTQGPGRQLTGVTLTVRSDGQDNFQNTFPIGATSDTQLPQEIGVRPRDANAATHPVTVLVTAVRDGNELFTTRAIASYEPEHIGLLEIFLAGRCVGVTCDPDSTCTQNGCEHVAPQSGLPLYRPLDAGGDDASFDAAIDTPDAADAGDVRDAIDTVDAVDVVDVHDVVAEDVSVIDVTDVASTDVVDATDSATDAAALSPARLIAPMSTSTTTTRRPTLHFALPASASGATVLVCSDRACATVIASGSVAAGASAYRIATDLAAGVAFWRVDAAGATSSNTWEFNVPSRSSPSDTSYDSFADVNGDGLADLVIGTSSSGFYVYQGAPTGPSTTATPFVAAPTMSNLGSVVASAGDVNGDGYSDVAVAATGGMGGVAGAIYVYAGSAAGLSTTPLAILSDSSAPALGTWVAGAGDVNGDGYADIVASDSGSDVAFIWHGGASGPAMTASTTLRGTAATYFGRSVGGAGDLDADGFADVVVGATRVDTAFVYRGSSTGLLAGAPITLVGPARGNFGFAARTIGDVNGDGYGDLAVGANISGNVLVYYGNAMGVATTASLTLSGPAVDVFGHSIGRAYDVNGDGYDDVLIGADAGYYTNLYLGGASGLAATPALVLTGPNASNFGYATIGAGDIDRDGHADIAIGATNNASVYVYMGTASGIPMTATTTLTGPLRSYFGQSLGD